MPRPKPKRTPLRYWLRKDFKVQQALWYELLKTVGFEDVEYGRDTDSSVYMQDDGTRYRLGRDHADLFIGAEIQEHAVDVGQRVGFFRSLEQRYTWRRFTDGTPLPEIAQELGRSRVHVWRVVTKVKERMNG